MHSGCSKSVAAFKRDCGLHVERPCRFLWFCRTHEGCAAAGVLAQSRMPTSHWHEHHILSCDHTGSAHAARQGRGAVPHACNQSRPL